MSSKDTGGGSSSKDKDKARAIFKYSKEKSNFEDDKILLVKASSKYWEYNIDRNTYRICKQVYRESHHGNFYSQNITHELTRDKTYKITVKWYGKKKVWQRLADFISKNERILATFDFIPEGSGRPTVLYVPNIYRKMIKDMIDYANEDDWPVDIVDLLNSMKNYKGESHLLFNHLAVLSSVERLGLLMSFQSRANCLWPDKVQLKYRTAVENMNVRKNNWIDLIPSRSSPGWDLILDSFVQSGGSYSRKIDTGDPFKIGIALVDFCRNLAAHIIATAKKHHNTGLISWLKGDITIVHTFGHELMSLQRNLNDEGILYMFTTDNKDVECSHAAPMHVEVYFGP
ncbi:hypothetical protein OROGR_023327 [Orobanche gracilis]